MTPEERRKLIAKYAEGFAEVAKALDGYPREKLAAHPLPGKWSAAGIVHHLADSEMNSCIRLRKLLTEPFTVIQGYDQDAWALALKYDERPIEPALDAFRAARSTNLQILERMTEADWRRHGWHSDAGTYHAERWLEIYAVHAHDHAAQIRRLREALPK